MAAEWRFDDSRLYPIYEKCQRLHIPVFHTTGMSWTRLSDSVPFAIDNVAADFPQLKICHRSHSYFHFLNQKSQMMSWAILRLFQCLPHPFL